MPRSEIEYVAPPTGLLFLRSNDFVREIMGPVGSGKSTLCCVEIVRRARETPPGPDGVRRSRWGVIRNTYVELRDTTIRTWNEWVPEPWFGHWRTSEHTFILAFETEDGAKVEAEVLFRALDRPEDVKKLLSLELTGCYFNEWKEIPKPVFDLMKTRVGRYPRKADVSRYWTGIFGDTNPPDTDHYLYKIMEEERPEGHVLFRQPSGFSPEAENIANLDRCWDPDPSLIEGKEAMKLAREEQMKKLRADQHEKPCRCYYRRLAAGQTEDFIKVMVRGEYGFVMDGKPVYPEFQDSIHTAKQPIPIPSKLDTILVGNDYGLTPAAVWVARDPRDGQYQVVREFVSEHMGATKFGQEQARICKTEFDGLKVAGFGDPAGMAGSSVDEELTPISVVNAAGVPMMAAPTNDFTIRRDAVGNLLTRLTVLGRPALVISPTCPILRKAMMGKYQFRRLQVRGDARYHDAPDKNEFSHVAEALQYAAVGAGEDLTVLRGGTLRGSRVSVTVRNLGDSTPEAQQQSGRVVRTIRR